MEFERSTVFKGFEVVINLIVVLGPKLCQSYKYSPRNLQPYTRTTTSIYIIVPIYSPNMLRQG